MNVNTLQPNLLNLYSTDGSLSSSFGSMLSSNPDDMGGLAINFRDVLMGSFDAASALDKADKVSAMQLLSGQSDDLSGLMLDMQKAELSLNLAIQIRNKLLDAFTEIMRMQV